MANVWAHRFSSYRRGGGFQHVIRFDNLQNLVESLNDEDIRGRVDRLAIVAHGNADRRTPGMVELGPTADDWLSAGSANFSKFPELREITKLFLSRNAMVSFESCIAGRGPSGTSLITRLSNLLTGCVIVAYTTWGFAGTTAARTTAGTMQGAPSQQPQPGMRLSPWGEFAKWAYQGRIVRFSLEERANQQNLACGNPRCLGHDSPWDLCEAWVRAKPALRQHRLAHMVRSGFDWG